MVNLPLCISLSHHLDLSKLKPQQISTCTATKIRLPTETTYRTFDGHMVRLFLVPGSFCFYISYFIFLFSSNWTQNFDRPKVEIHFTGILVLCSCYSLLADPSQCEVKTYRFTGILVLCTCYSLLGDPL